MQDAHCSEYSVVQDAQHAVYAQLRAVQKLPAASCWHSQSQRQCNMYLQRAIINSCRRLSPLQSSIAPVSTASYLCIMQDARGPGVRDRTHVANQVRI